MKKTYRIIMLCASVVLGVSLLWKTSENNVAGTHQPQQKTTVPQQQGQDADDFEDEGSMQEDSPRVKRLRDANEQWTKQRPYIRKSTPEELHANDYGAEAKITLRVMDSRGTPVEDATVFSFLYPRSESEAEITKGVTDKNGLFSVSGKTRSFVEYAIQKENYYSQKRGTYWVFRRDAEALCVKDGRWIPWNPTIEVTLKEKRNPIPMYVKQAQMKIPEMDKPVGYDLEKGDWVHPYGKGETPDMYMQYAETVVAEGQTLKRILTVTFPKEKDGLLRYEKDVNSPMFSAYEAEEGDYQNKMDFVMEWKDWQLIEDTQLTGTGYLVFRSRTETDESGNIVSACYGKISGPLEFGVGKAKYIRLQYWFNPIPNDRNLEPLSNLFER